MELCSTFILQHAEEHILVKQRENKGKLSLRQSTITASLKSKYSLQVYSKVVMMKIEYGN